MGIFPWKVSWKAVIPQATPVLFYSPHSSDFRAGIDGPLFLNEFAELILSLLFVTFLELTRKWPKKIKKGPADTTQARGVKVGGTWDHQQP